MRPRCLLATATISILVGSAAAQAPAALTLRDAVEAALRNQPSIKSAGLNVDLAEKRAGEARAERLPSVRISETLTHGNNPVFVFGSLLEQSHFGPQNFSLPALNNPAPMTNLRTALSVNLPAFDGMKTAAHVAQADIGKEQAVLQKKLAEQRIRFEAVRSYFDVTVALVAVEVANEAVRMAESDVKRAQDRVEAGLAVQSDLLASRVQLAEFRQRQIVAEGNLATAFAVLNVSMGATQKERYRFTTELVTKRFDVADPEELAARALRHRPDYAHAESAIRLTDRRISERRGDYLPGLNVFASFGSSARNLTSGSTDYAVGAGLTFNVFDPGRASRLAQSHSEHALAETERDRVANDVLIDVTRAFNSYRAAEQQVRVAEGAVQQAAESLRTIQDRYETGLTTVTDLLSAETTLVRARMNAAGARYAHYTGYANVLLSTGELDDVTAFEP